jgi:hypothetical protein
MMCFGCLLNGTMALSPSKGSCGIIARTESDKLIFPSATGFWIARNHGNRKKGDFTYRRLQVKKKVGFFCFT